VSARAEARHVATAAERRRVRLSARGILLLVVMGLILLAAVAPARNLIRQRAQLAQLREQTARLEQQNDALQARVDQLDDPTYLEQLARQCLGMVNPGEVAFVTVPRHGAPVPPNC
jgi:cell division protein FtsB